MSAFEYRDKQGNVTSAFLTTMPGIFLVPPGRTLQDAIPVTHKQFEQRIANITKIVAPDRLKILTDRLVGLQAEVEKLKQTKAKST